MFIWCWFCRYEWQLQRIEDTIESYTKALKSHRGQTVCSTAGSSTKRPWRSLHGSVKQSLSSPDPRTLKVWKPWMDTVKSSRPGMESVEERGYLCFGQKSWRGGTTQALQSPDSSNIRTRFQIRSDELCCLPCWVSVLPWSHFALLWFHSFSSH